MNYETIKAAVLKRGYAFFDNGDYNLNFIWVRQDMVATNRFTDTLYIAYRENVAARVIVVPCTTKPGIRGSLDRPITYDGVTGTAVIVPGQYRASWSFVDSYADFSKYPYFRQVGRVDYWRDGDRDGEIDMVNLQKAKVFGTHWHRMSNAGVTGMAIDNWSLGCIGCEEPYWKRVVELTRKAVRPWGLKFTGTVMEAADFA